MVQKSSWSFKLSLKKLQNIKFNDRSLIFIGESWERPLIEIKRFFSVYSETLELFSLTEPNRIGWNPNIFNISMFIRVRFDRTELCIIAFEWFYMVYLMFLNDFRKHRNIEKIRFGSIEQIQTNSVEFDSVRFSSIFQDSSRVYSIHIYACISYI